MGTRASGAERSIRQRAAESSASGGTPPRRGARRFVIDGALAAAAVLLAVLIVAVNPPTHDPPWPSTNVASSRRDLARDPLDPARERNLAFALARSGDTAAERLMMFAASRSRRDTPVENWLMVRGLSEGRFDLAFQAADALLRRGIDEEKRQRLLTLLIAAAHYNASRPAVVARLAEAPWWRLSYTRKLAAEAAVADVDRVFAGLAVTANPPTRIELEAYLTRLVEQRQYTDAARAWRVFSRPPRDPTDIKDASAPPPFGWSATFGDGGSSAIESGVLRVDYDGASTPRLPRRLMALAPGVYTIAWRERLEGDDAGRLKVDVICGEAEKLLTSVRVQAGATGWRENRLDFAIPAQDCAGQWLSITTAPGERRSSVTGYFEAWKLTARPSR